MTSKEILKEYTFPHAFYVGFLLDLAKYKVSLVKKPVKALDCINITELWLKNKATAEECKAAADNAVTYPGYAGYDAYIDAENYSASIVANSYAINAARAAYTTEYTAHIAYAATNAYSSANPTIAAAYTKKYEEIFFNNINKLTELEKTMVGL